MSIYDNEGVWQPDVIRTGLGINLGDHRVTLVAGQISVYSGNKMVCRILDSDLPFTVYVGVPGGDGKSASTWSHIWSEVKELLDAAKPEPGAEPEWRIQKHENGELDIDGLVHAALAETLVELRRFALAMQQDPCGPPHVHDAAIKLCTFLDAHGAGEAS